VNIVYEATVKENRQLFVLRFAPQTKLRFAFDESYVLVFPTGQYDPLVQPPSYPFGRDSSLIFIVEDEVNAQKLSGFGRTYALPSNSTFVLIKKTSEQMNVSSPVVGAQRG
jgi:hypothetical protein